MAPPQQLVFTGMIFELGIIIMCSIFTILVYRKYLEKRHQLTLYLFIIFALFVIAIIFSFLVKFLNLYSNIDYFVYEDVPDPMTVESWFLLRILGFRFTFTLVILAVCMSYVLRVKLFDKGYNSIERIIVFAFAIIAILFNIVFYEKGNLTFDLIAFFLTAAHIGIVYIPFMSKCLQNYKAVDNPTFKKAFLSLAIMALNFVLVLFFEFIDRITIFLGGDGYSVFYFLGWLCTLIAIIAAYFGYINPKSKEN